MQTLCIYLPAGVPIAHASESDQTPEPWNPDVQWAFYEGEVSKLARTSDLGEIEGALSEFANPNLRRVVIVPAEEVLVTQVSVPSSRASYLNKALPYLLEEQLVNPVETYFFAHQKIGADQVLVAAVDQQVMHAWITQLKQAGIVPDVLLVDVLLAPYTAGEITIALTDQQAYLRADDWRAAVFAQNQMPFYFKVLFGELEWGEATDETEPVIEAAEGPDTREVNNQQSFPVRLLYDEQDQTLGRRVKLHLNAIRLIDSRLDAQALYLPKSLTGLLFDEALSQVKQKTAFSLLQHDFSVKRKRKKLDRGWTQVMSLAASLFLIVCANLATQAHSYQQANDAQRQANEAYYFELFPNERRVQSIRSQMQAKLNRVDKPQDGRHFLHHYQSIGESLANARGNQAGSLDLRRMTFDQNQGEFRLDLFVPDFPVLDTLKNDLEKKRFLVQIDSANKEGNRVKARLRIRSA